MYYYKSPINPIYDTRKKYDEMARLFFIFGLLTTMNIIPIAFFAKVCFEVCQILIKLKKMSNTF